MKGWKQVFSFTFTQNIKGKSFKLALFGIAALVFVIAVAIHIIIGAVGDEEEQEPKEEVTVYEVETVYVVNHSGLPIAFENLVYEDTALEGIEIIDETKEAKKVLENIGAEDKKIVVAIEKYAYFEETDTYEIWDEQEQKGELTYRFLVYTQTGFFDEEEHREDAIAVAEIIAEHFEEQKKLALGLSEEATVILDLMVNSEIMELEEIDDSLGEVIAKMLVPMIVTLVIYMLVILYGQSISNIIVVEKSSKLMEMLLTSLEPYAIVFGKILAMFTVAMLQFGTWILSGVFGYIVGAKVAEHLFSGYEEPLGMLIEVLKEDAASAFSIPAVVLGLLILVLGFFMYCVLAGLFAAGIKKAEDVSNGSGVYQIVVVIAFLAAYMLPIAEVSDAILTIVRLIPISGAFMLPADLIIGNCSLMIGGIGLAIMLATTIILIYLTGKIYKKRIF